MAPGGDVATLVMAVDADHPFRPGYELKLNSLRSVGRYRARRRDPAPALRAPGRALRRGHRGSRSRVLLGREHLHARHVDALVQGQLLQVHERDAAVSRRRRARTAASRRSRRVAARPRAAATSSRSRATRPCWSTTAARRSASRRRRCSRCCLAPAGSRGSSTSAACAAIARTCSAPPPRASRASAQGLGPRRARRRAQQVGRGRRGTREGARGRADDRPRPRGRAAAARREDRARRVDLRVRDDDVRCRRAHGAADGPRTGQRAAGGFAAAGGALSSLQAFRELDDALLRLRFDYPDIGIVSVRTVGNPAHVVAYDEAVAKGAATNGFLREVRLLQRRVLKRYDNTARSLYAVADRADSCFAGVLLELALGADRFYMLVDGDDKVAVRTSIANAGFFTMSTGLSRLAARFYGDDAAVQRVLARGAEGAIASEDAEAIGIATIAADGIDFGDELRIAIEERASLSPDALTGMEAIAALRRARDDGDRRSSVACPRGRTGSSRARTRPASTARDLVRPTRAPAIPVEADLDQRSVMTAVITDDKIPNNVNLSGDRRLQRALEAWQPHFLDWWKQMGPRAGRSRTSTCAPRSASRARAGRTSTTSRCRTIAGASSSSRHGGAHHRLRRLQGPAGVGRGAGRVPQHAAPADRHAGRHRARERRAAALARRARARRSTTCETCSRSTSRRAGTCGRWSICSTRTSAAMAAKRPTSCSRGAAAMSTSRASSARSTSRRRLAVVLHVRDVHGSRRQVSARGAVRERLRSAGAHARASC